MVASWVNEALHAVRLVLLAWDANLTPRITGLEVTYAACFFTTVLSGIYLHWQAWIDRSYARSKSAATRRYAALTQSTADHLLWVTIMLVLSALVGAGVGVLALVTPQSLTLTEPQRFLGAVTRMVFVTQAAAMTVVNLTLVHWRDVATARARRGNARPSFQARFAHWLRRVSRFPLS